MRRENQDHKLMKSTSVHSQSLVLELAECLLVLAVLVCEMCLSSLAVEDLSCYDLIKPDFSRAGPRRRESVCLPSVPSFLLGAK